MPEPGVYNDAKVLQSVMSKSKNGKEQLAIQWSLESGESIWSYHYFSSEGALKWTVPALKAIGWDPNENGWRLEEINGTERLVGKSAQLELESEVFEGKPTTKVKNVNPPGGGGIREAMTAADVDDLSDRLRKDARERAEKAAVDAATEDVPF